jgi:hypothetical protein
VLTLFRERYEVLASIGSGGEAQIVKALDRQHGRFVALKIRPVRDQAAREDLLGEARLLLALPPHPALPLVREDFFDGGDYVVAMDWSRARISPRCSRTTGGRGWRRRACWPTSPRRPRR